MNKFLKKVKKFDQFAMPISLTHEGKVQYKTMVGTCGTFIFIVALLIYCIIEFKKYIFHPIKSISAQAKFVDANEFDYSKITLQGKDLLISFGFTEDLPASIGQVTFHHSMRVDGTTRTVELAHHACKLEP
jgi:nitrate/nitrite-specific signal transduction histidine kinase